MSFDLYLVSFADQQPSGVARSSVLAAFGDYVRWEDDHSGWTQYNPMDGCRISLEPLKSNPDLISCVSINRPLADQRFLSSLHKIMQLGCVALFFPGGKGPLIANPSVASHLPWEVVLRDRLPAYISWEQYEANQRQLRDNSLSFGRGAPSSIIRHSVTQGLPIESVRL
jgi:hypothetical protein